MLHGAHPRTMTAAVLHGRRDLRFEEVPVPVPGPGELLLRTTAVGLCGTDAAEWSKGPRLMPLETRHAVTGHLGPMVIGHEFAGRVIDVGEGVDESWRGRLVASCGADPCGECAHCRGGRSNVCRRYAAVGLHRDGALATYAVAPLAGCVDVGEYGIDEYEAALVQPMSIAVHSAHRAGAASDDVAVVQGVGGVGAFLVHALASLGVRVVAVDLDAARLEIARTLGAAQTILASSEGAAGEIEASWGERLPLFFEVSGSPAGMRLAVDMLPMGSRIIAVGIAKAPYELDLGRVTFRELEIIGTNAMVRETDLTEAARLVALRKGRWGDVAPAPIPFEAVVDEALAPIAEGRAPAIKTLVLPPGE